MFELIMFIIVMLIPSLGLLIAVVGLVDWLDVRMLHRRNQKRMKKHPLLYADPEYDDANPKITREELYQEHYLVLQIKKYAKSKGLKDLSIESLVDYFDIDEDDV